MATHQDTHSQQLNMTVAPRVFETLAANSIFTQLITREDFIAFTILRLLIVDVTPCSLLQMYRCFKGTCLIHHQFLRLQSP